ncbi:hypothetical protein [Hydrogenophaga intermedia]|uniref:hypothetical protein n=1 Tax=Hydrogenophaga intermedia TaxID=65786 RepID=UPI002043BCEB|nr:hypothetical protein [Hydrogenophaga intermedia]MCM3565910.1 hypothetical protein [Hydrogenophaga intermedia]
MNLLREKQRCLPMGAAAYLGSKSSSASTNTTTTTTSDNRNVTESGVAISGSSGSINVNSPDAVKAVAQMGTDALKTVGGSVVELNQASLDANLTAWDKTITAGAALVDKIIDKSSSIATDAITTYQPNENRREETYQMVGLAAAAAFAAYAIFK